MIVYFLLIGFASLLVSVEFIVETRGGGLEKELLSNLKLYSNGAIDDKALFAPVDRLGKKAMLMVAIILSVMVIVLTMFIKNITEPLQYMIDLSKKIASGDLRQSITIHSHNEISELGNVINELSGNLQEITLMSKNMCESGRVMTENIIAILNSPEFGEAERMAARTHIENLNIKFNMLMEFIEYFDFYTVASHDG